MSPRGFFAVRLESAISKPAHRSSDAPDRTSLLGSLETNLSPAAIRRRQNKRIVHGGSEAFWKRVSAAAKRVGDILVASVILVTALPFLAPLYLVARARGGGIRATHRLGLGGEPFEEWSLSLGSEHSPAQHRPSWSRLPALVNVLRGDMSLIGPRPFTPGEVYSPDRWTWKRFLVKPGLICLWWLRKRANIAYGSETEVDAQYVDDRSVSGDLGIMLRAIPAAFYGDTPTDMRHSVELLGIPIDNLTMEQAVARITGFARDASPHQVCFVNADCVNIAYRDPDYRSLLQACGTVLADGIGVKLAGRLLKRNIRENVNGTDLLPKLCERLQEDGIGVYLLGGKPGVPEDVAQWILSHFPALPIRGLQHGYFEPDDVEQVLDKIKDSRADVLLVALGAPKQDKWLRDYLSKTGCKVGIGVGGLFDFYVGRIARAPVWVREIGMEWFYRFWQEPRRMWRRYFAGNLLFLARVLINRRSTPKV